MRIIPELWRSLNQWLFPPKKVDPNSLHAFMRKADAKTWEFNIAHADTMFDTYGYKLAGVGGCKYLELQEATRQFHAALTELDTAHAQADTSSWWQRIQFWNKFNTTATVVDDQKAWRKCNHMRTMLASYLQELWERPYQNVSLQQINEMRALHGFLADNDPLALYADIMIDLKMILHEKFFDTAQGKIGDIEVRMEQWNVLKSRLPVTMHADVDVYAALARLHIVEARLQSKLMFQQKSSPGADLTVEESQWLGEARKQAVATLSSHADNGHQVAIASFIRIQLGSMRSLKSASKWMATLQKSAANGYQMAYGIIAKILQKTTEPNKQEFVTNYNLVAEAADKYGDAAAVACVAKFADARSLRNTLTDVLEKNPDICEELHQILFVPEPQNRLHRLRNSFGNTTPTVQATAMMGQTAREQAQLMAENLVTLNSYSGWCCANVQNAVFATLAKGRPNVAKQLKHHLYAQPPQETLKTVKYQQPVITKVDDCSMQIEDEQVKRGGWAKKSAASWRSQLPSRAELTNRATKLMDNMPTFRMIK